jgi:hypothetical protein
VGRDDDEVVSSLRVMSKILGNSTTDTQNLMLERKLSLPPSITSYNRSSSPQSLNQWKTWLGKRFSELRGSMARETTAVGITKLL